MLITTSPRFEWLYKKMATAADEEKEAAGALKLPRYNYGIVMSCDFPDENK